MWLEEARRRLKGVTEENAVLLKEMGDISYYLFEGGVLVVSRSEERDLPYLRARTSVVPFEELPDFLKEEVRGWLERVMRGKASR